MVELARCSKLHRIIDAGTHSSHLMFELHRRGYNRVAIAATYGLPGAQYDVALLDGRLQSVNVLQTTLRWLVRFLAPTSVLQIWISAWERTGHQKLRSIFERLRFQIEAWIRCEHGLAISACRSSNTSLPLFMKRQPSACCHGSQAGFSGWLAGHRPRSPIWAPNIMCK
jgi:hypothetical protein